MSIENTLARIEANVRAVAQAVVDMAGRVAIVEQNTSVAASKADRLLAELLGTVPTDAPAAPAAPAQVELPLAGVNPPALVQRKGSRAARPDVEQSGRAWTPRADKRLLGAIFDLGLRDTKQIGVAVGRSAGSVERRLWKHGIRCSCGTVVSDQAQPSLIARSAKGKPWTSYSDDEERQIIDRRARGESWEEIAAALGKGRSAHAILVKHKRLTGGEGE